MVGLLGSCGSRLITAPDGVLNKLFVLSVGVCLLPVAPRAKETE